jgi:chromosomal replication initiation ATPase DnaA
VGEDRPIRKRRVSLEELVREVARDTGLKAVDLKGPSRVRNVSRARALVALRARELGGVSISSTARSFGRDDSTLLRGVASAFETSSNNAGTQD